jgi:hypothetical protein
MLYPLPPVMASFPNMLEIAQITNGARAERCGIDKRSPPNFVLHSDYHLNSL